jgi:transcriptional regulator with GAF, ATPase, and Fis domain
MALRSVLCVPIRSAHGTLGALYLDNRFQRGRFQEEHLPLLLAFSDQVALALRNAQLVERLEERTRQLEQRTRELEVEKRRAQALVRSQAEELDGLQQELRSRGQDRQSRYDYHAIVGRSPAMAALFLRLDRIVETALPVLVQGDSGTGKELVAHAIHSQGPRHDQPFVAVNCAALPEQLLESELFGYVKGAFTGAGQDRQGRFIEADGGTLFLDEIGELPWSVQAKLLRVLEDGKVRPLGSNRDRPVDVRLVSATNRRLRDEAQRGNFREDLFFRIAVMEVTLPSLTERIEDLPLLASHFLKQLGDELGRPGLRLRPGALRKLARFGWPGNIRQLRNVLARAAVLAQGNLLVPYLRFSAQIGHKSDRRLNVRRGP